MENDDMKYDEDGMEMYRPALKYMYLNDMLTEKRKEMDPDYEEKFKGKGVFHSAGDKGHFPWLWE